MRAIAIVAALATPLLPGPARAGPDKEAQARKLFDQGRQLSAQEHWSEACPLFQAAHDLHATNGTALQLANCYEKIGDPDRASTYYRYVVDHGGNDKLPERVELARQRLAALEAQHATAAAPKDALSPEPQPAGSAVASAAPIVPPPASVGPRAPESRPLNEIPASEPGPNRTPAYVALGFGGVGVAVGAIFGLIALRESNTIKASCIGNLCPRGEEPAASVAKRNAWISTAGFAVGIAGLGTALVLLMTTRNPARSAGSHGAAAGGSQ